MQLKNGSKHLPTTLVIGSRLLDLSNWHRLPSLTGTDCHRGAGENWLTATLGENERETDKPSGERSRAGGGQKVLEMLVQHDAPIHHTRTYMCGTRTETVIMKYTKVNIDNCTFCVLENSRGVKAFEKLVVHEAPEPSAKRAKR